MPIIQQHNLYKVHRDKENNIWKVCRFIFTTPAYYDCADGNLGRELREIIPDALSIQTCYTEDLNKPNLIEVHHLPLPWFNINDGCPNTGYKFDPDGEAMKSFVDMVNRLRDIQTVFTGETYLKNISSIGLYDKKCSVGIWKELVRNGFTDQLSIVSKICSDKSNRRQYTNQ